MGILRCSKCKAIADANTFEDADELIDHGIGLLVGNGCLGDPTNMTWDKDGYIGKSEKDNGKYISKNPKPVARNNLEMLVGESDKKTKDDGKSKGGEPPKDGPPSTTKPGPK